MSDERLQLSKRVRTMQIIAGALIMGVVMMTTVVVVMNINNGGEGLNRRPGLPAVTLVAGIMLFVNAPLSLFLPTMMTRAAVRNIAAGRWRAPQGSEPAVEWTDELKLIMIRQTSMIVAMALVEGAAFCAAIAYLLEGNPIALGLVAVGLGLLAWNFPTEGGVRAWLFERGEELKRAKH